MGNKGKRRARQRRRESFFTLCAARKGDCDISSLVDEARKRSRTSQHRVRRDEYANEVAENAFRTADQVTELYITNLPHQLIATDLVKALHTVLYSKDVIPLDFVLRVSYTSDPFPESPVLRCEIRLPRDTHRTPIAYVSVRSQQFVDHLLQSSPLFIRDRPVSIVLCKRPILPGVGSAWRSRRGPGTASWRVGMVQFGEKVADHLFSTFWASSQFFDLSENCHIELNPVERILALTIGSPHSMWKATSIYSNFSKTEAIMRIEIPFRSICGSPCVERNPDSKQDCAVYFHVTRPPFLFRAEESSFFITDPDLQRQLLWDCSQDAFESVRWIRSIDPTSQDAFARARGFRIMLGTADMNALFEHLHRMCIADSNSPYAVPGTHRAEKRSPNRHYIFQRAGKTFKVPFSARYMVERILSLFSISLSSITTQFWSTLSMGVSEKDALAALDLMLFRLSEQEYFSRNDREIASLINDPIQILQECMDMCNIERKGSRRDEGTGVNRELNGDADSVGDDSESSDGTEEFAADEVFQRLAAEELDMDVYGESAQSTQQVTSDIHSATLRLPSRQHALIRRLLLTPTRVIAQPPETDLLNRVLREFAVHDDRFLRISFCDEDGGSIGHTGSDDLYARIRAALRDGVHVAGEKFVFLAFSNSQLRDHAVWMYNETVDPSSDVSPPPSANEIRAWMGDFSKIRCPGKFAARQGQTFSSTVGTVLLDDVQKHVVDDVYNTSGEYMFSDGVGLMSSELARRVSEKLRLTSREQIPSAFQVRFGGAKGILTVWDAAFPIVGKLKDGQVEVILRGSMKKFECNHKALEIVGYSKRLPMFLNRQIITLLSGLGVADEVFEDLQNKVLLQLDRAMEEDGANDALHLLYASGVVDGGIKLRLNGPTMDAAAFFRAGLTCVSCEHLFNMMYAYRKRTIRDLMVRARIPIDSDKGVCLIGVVDEVGVLEPNEVFCQYTDPSTEVTQIVTGRVTVGRSPCLHPGDIQPVVGVDRAELHHLLDVVVFPQKGDRPIPSMLSGGDLDGDIYFCIFDKTIPFPRDEGYLPMRYTAPKAKILEHEVRTEDVADFFVEYIRNDKLGVIANAHVVHADKEEAGILSRKCLVLAELHSVAVDFAKTGVSAEIPGELLPRNVREQYPDFMGKHAKVSYKSTRILGKLYRGCRACGGDGTDGANELRFAEGEAARRVDAVMDGLAEGEDVRREAESMCSAYNVEMVRLMEQFGVGTEGEVVSGQVVSFSERHAQLRGRREHFALQMKVNRQMDELRAQFREEFFRDMEGSDEGEYSVETILKGSAWYKACRRQAELDKKSGNAHFVSFPWVVSDVLLRVIGNELRLRS